MNNEWREKVIKFFENVENRKLDDWQTAVEYAKLWWTGCALYKNRNNRGFINYIETSEYKNLALLNKFEDKFDMCKRTLLISDVSILWETGLENQAYCIEEYREPGGASYVNPSVYNYDAYLKTKSINDLGRFLKGNRELIESGYTVYIPNIMVDYREDNNLLGDINEILNPSEDTFESLLKGKSSSSCQLSRRFIEDKYLRVVTEIEIPYIDDCPESVLIKIIEKYTKEFSNFRLYLKEELIKLKEENGSNSFDTDIKKIGIDIQKGVNVLNSDIKKLNRHALMKAGSGFVIGCTVATLVAINGAVFNMNTLEQLLTYLGAGGGIISMSNFIESYLNNKQDMKEKPFYFVWLLHKKC